MKMTEWISVKDRLPEWREWVLVTHVGEVDRGRLIEDYGYPRGYYWDVVGYEGLIDVTHWMPLPKPPEKKDI